MSVQTVELLSAPEILSDLEVDARFAEMVADIDDTVSPEQEERLNNTPLAKIRGNEEEYSMWGNYVK